MQHVKPPRLDVEPTIALANAEDWTRRLEATGRKPFAHDLIQQARAERSAYQGELILRFIRFVTSSLRFSRTENVSPPVAPVKIRQR